MRPVRQSNAVLVVYIHKRKSLVLGPLLMWTLRATTCDICGRGLIQRTILVCLTYMRNRPSFTAVPSMFDGTHPSFYLSLINSAVYWNNAQH